MAENEIRHLRVLIANERHDRLELLARSYPASDTR